MRTSTEFVATRTTDTNETISGVELWCKRTQNRVLNSIVTLPPMDYINYNSHTGVTMCNRGRPAWKLSWNSPRSSSNGRKWNETIQLWNRLIHFGRQQCLTSALLFNTGESLAYVCVCVCTTSKCAWIRHAVVFLAARWHIPSDRFTGSYRKTIGWFTWDWMFR